MTVNEEQKKDLKKGRKELKRQIETAERQPVNPVPPPQVDMVEQIAQSVSPRSAAWIREAKDHLKDERSVRKMFRAHEDAVEDGITPDTDEYFAFIEGRLGINRQQQQEVESPMSSAAAPTPRRSSPPPAAPVSRQSTPSNVMRLTRSEIDTARDLGMTPEEYAKNKSLLIKEKRYGN